MLDPFFLLSVHQVNRYTAKDTSWHAWIRKVLSEGGPPLTMCFLVDEGRKDPNTTI